MTELLKVTTPEPRPTKCLSCTIVFPFGERHCEWCGKPTLVLAFGSPHKASER